MSSSTDLYVVEVDSRASGHSSDFNSYHEKRSNADYFQNKIVEHPKMVCCQSRVATLCGKDIKIYFMKYKTGLAQHFRRGGASAVMQTFMADQTLLSQNNGAATYLTSDIDSGLSEYIVCGKAYVVENDGKAPLSRGQVWGLQEMINCANGVYDMDPVNMAEGKRVLQEWAEEYRQGIFNPSSGTGGVDIYSPRKD